MTVTRVMDWSYLEARRRLVRTGRLSLAQHTATPTLDEDGNRRVTCGCGWRGNGIGWAAHLESVVRSAVDEDILP